MLVYYNDMKNSKQIGITSRHFLKTNVHGKNNSIHTPADAHSLLKENESVWHIY